MIANNTKHFVNREAELHAAEELLHGIKQGAQPGFSIWEFNGIAGVGKTALLKFIQEMARSNEVAAIYIDMADTPINSPTRLVEFIDNKVSDTQYNIIFFDSLDRLSPSALEILGHRIVLPLSERRRALLCVANRERTNWGTNKYKLNRRTKCSTLDLFSLKSTQEQLEGSNFEKFAGQIMSITGGHPESNSLVLQILEDVERLDNVTILHDNFGDFEARLIEEVFDGIRRDYLIPSEDFDSFYTLSILRFIDVTIPLPFLESIDSHLNWNEQQNTIDLLSKMQRSSELLEWQPHEKHYVMNSFIRRLFSLHMRVFFVEKYLQLTSAAVKYYDDRLRSSLTDSSPDVRALVEKMFHAVDLERLTSPRSADLQIALRLKNQLLNDLERTIPGGGVSLRRRGLSGEMQSFDTRLKTLESLKQILRQDEELHARLGDSISHQAERFLLDLVDDYEKVFLSADHAILDIVRAASLGSGHGIDEYKASFIAGSAEPISESSITIMAEDRNNLLNLLHQKISAEELSILGNWMFNKFLKDEVYNLVNEQVNLKGPITITVDDTSIPWELLHDSNDFIAFKVPLGKRFRTAEPRLPRWGPYDKPQDRCLLVGVPETRLQGYQKLVHVEEEIESLTDLFLNRSEYTFSPGEDILYGKEATGMALETKLLSGRYRIIHFAGHAQYDMGKGDEMPSPSLVMYDRLLRLDDIKSMTKGQPFVFLNACQTAFEKNIKVTTGYVGNYTIGIASAFILAGAVACVGSIWPILDSRASEFARIFYDRLSSKKSLGEALRSAKETYRFQHPHQHDTYDTTAIGYVLYGDPTQQLIRKQFE